MDYKMFFEELVNIISDTNKPIDEIKELAQGEMGILCSLFLKREQGLMSLTSGQLSSLLKVSTGRVAIALKALEKKGYIERHIDTEDRRKINVNLTEQGLIFAKKEYEKVMDTIKKVFEELGEDDAKEFLRLIKKVKQISKKIHG